MAQRPSAQRVVLLQLALCALLLLQLACSSRALSTGRECYNCLSKQNPDRWGHWNPATGECSGRGLRDSLGRRLTMHMDLLLDSRLSKGVINHFTVGPRVEDLTPVKICLNSDRENNLIQNPLYVHLSAGNAALAFLLLQYGALDFMENAKERSMINDFARAARSVPFNDDGTERATSQAVLLDWLHEQRFRIWLVHASEKVQPVKEALYERLMKSRKIGKPFFLGSYMLWHKRYVSKGRDFRDAPKECTGDEDCVSTDRAFDAHRFHVCCKSSPLKQRGTCTSAWKCKNSEGFISTLFSAQTPLEDYLLDASIGTPSSHNPLEMPEYKGCDALQPLDQKNCGTCWAHAVASTVSIHLFLQTSGRANFVVSPQELSVRSMFGNYEEYEKAMRLHGSNRKEFLAFAKEMYLAARPKEAKLYKDDRLYTFMKIDGHFGTTSEAMRNMSDRVGVFPKRCRPYHCRKVSPRAALIAQVFTAHMVSKLEQQQGRTRPSFSRLPPRERNALSGAGFYFDVWKQHRFHRDATRKSILLNSVIGQELVDAEPQCMNNKVIRVRTDATKPSTKLFESWEYVEEVQPFVFLRVDPLNEYEKFAERLFTELRANGPLAVSIDGDLQNREQYALVKGVHIPRHFLLTYTHAVVLLGWGTTPEGIPYWLLQNSWGTSWNDGGYFKAYRGLVDAGCLNEILDKRDPSPDAACGLDLFVAHAPPGRDDSEGMGLRPNLAPQTVESLNSLGSICEEAGIMCKHGIQRTDCKCICNPPYTGEMCDQCGEVCEGEHNILDSETCTCNCAHGHFGPTCAASASFGVWACPHRSGNGRLRIRIVTKSTATSLEEDPRFTLKFSAGDTEWEQNFRGHTRDWVVDSSVKQSGTAVTAHDMDRTYRKDMFCTMGYITESLGKNELGLSKGSKTTPMKVLPAAEQASVEKMYRPDPEFPVCHDMMRRTVKKSGPRPKPLTGSGKGRVLRITHL